MKSFITLPTTKLVNFSRCVDVVCRSVMNNEFASNILIKTLSPDYVEVLNLCEPYVVDMVIENTTHCMFPPVVLEKEIFNKLTHSKEDVRIGMKGDSWFFETIGVDVFLRTKNTDLSIYDVEIDTDCDGTPVNASDFAAFSRAYQLTAKNMPSEQLAICSEGRVYFRTSGASANYRSPFDIDGIFGNSVINLLSIAVETEPRVSIGIYGKSVVISGDELTIYAPLRKSDTDAELVKSSDELKITDDANAMIDVPTLVTFLKKINGLGYFNQSVSITPDKERISVRVYSQDLGSSWEYSFIGKSEISDTQYIFNIPGLLQFFDTVQEDAKFSWCKIGLKAVSGDSLLNLRRQIRL